MVEMERLVRHLGLIDGKTQFSYLETPGLHLNPRILSIVAAVLAAAVFAIYTYAHQVTWLFMGTLLPSWWLLAQALVLLWRMRE
jgi:hypothetical protein